MKIINEFWVSFEGCPFGTHALVGRALALYGANDEKKEKRKRDFFASSQFVVTEASANVIFEKIHGSFEIFSCRDVDGKTFPTAVMLIDIEAGIVTVKISSQGPFVQQSIQIKE